MEMAKYGNRKEWQKGAGDLMHPDEEGKFIKYGIYVGINHPAYQETCEILKKYSDTNKGG